MTSPKIKEHRLPGPARGRAQELDLSREVGSEVSRDRFSGRFRYRARDTHLMPPLPIRAVT